MISNTDNTYNLLGKDYPISGQIEVRDSEDNVVGYLPLVDIPMTSDYKWQLTCLKDRLDCPDVYSDIDDNVHDAVCRLKNWLEEHKTQATEKELCDFEALKSSYNL